jgi:copper chaperone CopZ
LEDTEGVRLAKTNYAKSMTEVEFDPQKISEKHIIAFLKKTGYTAIVHD